MSHSSTWSLYWKNCFFSVTKWHLYSYHDPRCEWSGTVRVVVSSQVAFRHCRGLSAIVVFCYHNVGWVFASNTCVSFQLGQWKENQLLGGIYMSGPLLVGGRNCWPFGCCLLPNSGSAWERSDRNTGSACYIVKRFAFMYMIDTNTCTWVVVNVAAVLWVLRAGLGMCVWVQLSLKEW